MFCSVASIAHASLDGQRMDGWMDEWIDGWCTYRHTWYNYSTTLYHPQHNLTSCDLLLMQVRYQSVADHDHYSHGQQWQNTGHNVIWSATPCDRLSFRLWYFILFVSSDNFLSWNGIVIMDGPILLYYRLPNDQSLISFGVSRVWSNDDNDQSQHSVPWMDGWIGRWRNDCKINHTITYGGSIE